MLLELLAKLGVIPGLGQSLDVQVGPVRLSSAVVATHKVAYMHLSEKPAADTASTEVQREQKSQLELRGKDNALPLQL